MKDAAPKTIYLKDYQAPEFLLKSTLLEFELGETETLVRSKLQFEKNASSDTLILHGQDLELLELTLDGKALADNEYAVTEEGLSIFNVPSVFTLNCLTRIKPQDNTSLEGLYKSRTMFCTQCEAEGFRKITYYLDRPDVLSVFRTKITADKSRYPVLLSNGNPVGKGDLDNGRHWVEWHDPFPKPSYLFALVAGDLKSVNDGFITASGRHVAIELYVEEKDLDKCEHAIISLKNAMKWDEDVYGREYDLDIYMIVAVDDFNMGAMENKGLNIFNTSCVLANQKTTTDAGFQRVEGVVAHEYFHNWSGNRVTCRDWFQLSLKEGFTVFRDEEFSADMGSRTVKRVEDVQLLRSMQFAEDAGPMAHPVQPSSFIEISNFYTLTVYEKGSEVVRMIRTLLGADLFRKGSDLYFERHDGQAVTIDDFVQAMTDASGRDFSQFMNWYRQAGTPSLKVSGEYDEEARTFTLNFSQSCPSTPEATAEEKQAFLIPVAMGLIGDAGGLRLQCEQVPDSGESADNTHLVLEVTEREQSFVFKDVPEKPVPSLLRNFSAPVKLSYPYSASELRSLMTKDDDGFCRWDASQQLALKALADNEAQNLLIQAFDVLLQDESLDPAMVALMMELPSEAYIGEQQSVVDIEGNHESRKALSLKIASALQAPLLKAYKRCQNLLPEEFKADAQSIALRSLKNTCLKYLMLQNNPEAHSLCQQQFDEATNMTDQLSALSALVNSEFEEVVPAKAAALESFYFQWKDESLVVNYWFSVQASCNLPGGVERATQLLEHEAFSMSNPNKVRAVVGAFANQNLINFHEKSGSGYQFLADRILELNSKNPQIAARLVTPLSRWRRYDESRASLMKAQLQRLADEKNLSKDVFEIVNKSLNNA